MTSSIPVASSGYIQQPSELSEINSNTKKNKLPEIQSNAVEQMNMKKANDPVLLSRLKAQIEFYFSPQNLSRDTYLRSLLVYTYYPTGAAPLPIIAAFPKVRSLCAGDVPGNIAPPADATLVARSLEGSELVAVSPDNAWIISRFPTPPLMSMAHARVNHPAQTFVPTSRDSVQHYEAKMKTNRDAATQNSLVDQTSQLQINTTSKERTTVILRDIPEDCEVEKVLAAFTTDTIKPKAARPDIGNTWYVSFNSEADAIAAVFTCKGNEIDGQPIRARVKSEQIRSSEASRPSSPAISLNPPLPATENAYPTVGPNNKHLHPSAPPAGIQLNRPTQAPPPNYPHFSHIIETQQYGTQQQQIYPPQYGMPLHVIHNRHSSLPPPNYSFSPHLQPFIHHGNPVPYPIQQHGPYFVNSTTSVDIPGNLLAQQSRENYQLIGQRFASQRNPQGVAPYGNTSNESINSDTRSNVIKTAMNNQGNVNPSDRSVNLKVGNHSKNNGTSTNAMASNQADAGKQSTQAKRHKNTANNRGSNKADGNSGNQGNSENGYKNNNSNYNGKQKGKNRKNRKNNANSNNDSGQNSGKNVVKEVIVMNTLNFPELTSDNSKSSEKIDSLAASNGTNNTDANQSASAGYLTGYAAALRQNRNKVIEDKEKNSVSANGQV